MSGYVTGFIVGFVVSMVFNVWRYKRLMRKVNSALDWSENSRTLAQASAGAEKAKNDLVELMKDQS